MNPSRSRPVRGELDSAIRPGRGNRSSPISAVLFWAAGSVAVAAFLGALIAPLTLISPDSQLLLMVIGLEASILGCGIRSRHELLSVVGGVLFVGWLVSYGLRTAQLAFVPGDYLFARAGAVGPRELLEVHIIVGGAIATALVVAWFARGPASRIPRSDSIYAFRNVAGAACVAMAVQILLRLATNIGNPGATVSGPVALVAALVPSTALIMAVFSVGLRAWRFSTLAARLLAASAVILWMLSLFIVGKRGAIVSPLVYFGIVLITEGAAARRRTLAVTACATLMVLLVFPSFLSAVTAVRYGVFAGSGPLGQGDRRTVEYGYSDGFALVAERVAGMDQLVAILHVPPALGTPAPSAAPIMRSALGRIVPRALWEATDLPLGKLFALRYQGHTLEDVHHGAWTGIGLAVAMFGRAGLLVAVAGWALVSMAILRLAQRFRTPGLRASLVYFLIFVALAEGNVDDIFALSVTNVVFGAAVLRVVRSHSAIPVRGAGN